jgi:hypothetical protein
MLGMSNKRTGYFQLLSPLVSNLRLELGATVEPVQDELTLGRLPQIPPLGQRKKGSHFHLLLDWQLLPAMYVEPLRKPKRFVCDFLHSLLEEISLD